MTPSFVRIYGPPLLFVYLWSTGFISAKFGLPSAEPFTFLAIRMSITALVLLALLPFFTIRWPRKKIDYLHITVVGILVHGIYLGGVFSAIHNNLSSTITALIIGLQPILTVVISAFWLQEKFTVTKAIGLALGLIGIVLVVGSQGVNSDRINAIGIMFSAIGLVAIVIGTLYQKKFCSHFQLLPSIFVQFAANAIFTTIVALLFETREVTWNSQFILALSWLVLVLSVGTTFLLMWLIRHGEAGKVSSLFYLVPPVVLIQAWFLFEERLDSIAIIGMIACVLGVALVVKSPSTTNKV